MVYTNMAFVQKMSKERKTAFLSLLKSNESEVVSEAWTEARQALVEAHNSVFSKITQKNSRVNGGIICNKIKKITQCEGDRNNLSTKQLWTYCLYLNILEKYLDVYTVLEALEKLENLK